jgi:nucleotide-binding universal stress UspA family protein
MTYRIDTIVAGVGTLSENDPTLLLALGLTRRCGATLHLVHAFEFPRIFTLEPGAEAMYPDAATRMAAEMRERLASLVRSLPGGESVVCHVQPGTPGEAIRRTAAAVGANLVVVGAAGGNRLGQAILGTTAQRVLREVEVPVLVTRVPLERAPGRVLLTTDLTELSAMVHERGLDVLEGLFGSREGALRSLLVLAYDIVPPPLSAATLQRTAAAELDAFLDERDGRGVAVDPALRTGPAAVEIVREASEWGADLLVVGTHARHGLQRLMLGSVAEAVVRDAPCNVLAIPPYLRAAQVEAPAAAVALPAPIPA